MRLALTVICLGLLSGITQTVLAATKVTEADYQTYRKLSYAESLFEKRKMFHRVDKAKVAAAKADLEKTWAESGWTRDRHSEVDDAINEVLSNLSSARSGDITAEDLKAALIECDSTTVATVRAHEDELENLNDSTAAEQQVRDEIAKDRAGEIVTEAQLIGTWVFDVDATIEFMGLARLDPDGVAKARADLVEKVGTPSYTFGAGNTVETRTKGADGQERIDKAVYRLDGHTMYIKGEGSRREHDLQVGLREGRLLLGKGFGASVFVRQ